jgi:hypothetical protein
MRYARKKAGMAGVLVALIGVTLSVVLPAFASDPGHLVAPASTPAQVLPYDVAVGGTGDCANLFTSPNNSLGTGIKEYDNVNPKTTNGINLSSGNKDNVTFGLTMNTDSNKNQTLDVKSAGAAILGIGIKGGTQSTAYNYKRYTTAGFVTADNGLHGPLQSFTYDSSNNTETGAQFYSVSQLSVCYKLASYIQGTVYQDVDQSGGFSSGDTRPTGWTVRLYKDVAPGTPGGGTLIASASTVDTGSYSYHFDLPVDGTHYRVCEVPSGAPPTGTDVWVETQPLPSSTTLCSGSGELAKGYDFTPTSSAGATDDFGNVGGFSCDSPASVGIAPYTVGKCKTGQTYVFNFGTLNPNTLNEAPFVDYWVGDPSQANVPVVEQLNFADPIVNGQPKNTKLLYADGGGFPVSLNSLQQMKYCQVDPRTDSGFTLSLSYDTLDESGAVLPTGETSCVISITTTAPVAPNAAGTLQAYVYALGDSIRSTG